MLRLFFALFILTSLLKAEVIDLNDDQKHNFLECINTEKSLPKEGWIKSLFLYGKGFGCLEELLNRSRPDFYSLSVLEILSGTKIDSRNNSTIINNNKYSWEKQLYINPDFIKWVQNNGIISQTNDKLYALADAFYKKQRGFILSFIHAYDYITKKEDFEKELELYKQKIATGYVLRHLFDRYHHKIQKLYPNESADQITFGIGFWFRREIDGSKKDIYNLIVKLIANHEKKSDKHKDQPLQQPKLSW